MTYETAPSTLLIASNCAACGRALRDASSVESGMGPECREKHGYGLSEGEPSWSRAEGLLRAAGHELPAGWGSNAHAVANVLVHRCAVEQRKAPLALAAAIEALGYRRLGARLMERLLEDATITVERVGEELAVRAPFNADFNREIVYVRGQRFDRQTMRRFVPAAARRELWAALKKTFEPGTLVACGEKIAAL